MFHPKIATFLNQCCACGDSVVWWILHGLLLSFATLIWNFDIAANKFPPSSQGKRPKVSFSDMTTRARRMLFSPLVPPPSCLDVEIDGESPSVVTEGDVSCFFIDCEQFRDASNETDLTVLAVPCFIAVLGAWPGIDRDETGSHGCFPNHQTQLAWELLESVECPMAAFADVVCGDTTCCLDSVWLRCLTVLLVHALFSIVMLSCADHDLK